MKDSNISLDFSIYDDLSAESIEALRQVLEIEHGKSFTSEEVREIGVGVLKLFEVLADSEQQKCVTTEEEITAESQQSTVQLSLIN